MNKKKEKEKRELSKGDKPCKYTIGEMIEALDSNGGLVTYAAKKLGCHYTTVLNYIEKYPEVAEAKQQIDENIIDLAEDTLVTNIKEGNIDSTKYFLRKGRQRGYADRQEISGPDGKPMQHQHMNVNVNFVNNDKEKK
jgi:hypothetical protein